MPRTPKPPPERGASIRNNLLLAPEQLLAVLGDVTGRFDGGEGDASLGAVRPLDEGEARRSMVELLVPTSGHAEPQVLPVLYDDVSQCMVPWVRPDAGTVEEEIAQMRAEVRLASRLRELAAEIGSAPQRSDVAELLTSLDEMAGDAVSPVLQARVNLQK